MKLNRNLNIFKVQSVSQVIWFGAYFCLRFHNFNLIIKLWLMWCNSFCNGITFTAPSIDRYPWVPSWAHLTEFHTEEDASESPARYHLLLQWKTLGDMSTVGVTPGRNEGRRQAKGLKKNGRMRGEKERTERREGERMQERNSLGTHGKEDRGKEIRKDS